MLKQESPWKKLSVRFPELTGKHGSDVLVIGGGITGLTSALLLAREGKKVSLIEKDALGSGETLRTTAHLTYVLDKRYFEFLKHHGLATVRLLAQAHERAIDFVEQLITQEKIDCSFRRIPGFLYAEEAAELDILENELEAFRQLELPAQIVSRIPLPFSVIGALQFERQAQFAIGRYLEGLVKLCLSAGVQIYENSPAHAIEEGTPCRVSTPKGEFMATDVIVATHVPISHKVVIHTKMAAYRTYVVGAKVAGLEGEAPGLFWDVKDPYHYLRTTFVNNERILLLGGADHKTGKEEETDKEWDCLEEYLEARFSVDQVSYLWSGQVMEPIDGMAYIGKPKSDGHLFYATGFSGNGMTYGTLAAQLMSNLILRGASPYEKLFCPKRINAGESLPSYLLENKDFPILFLKDRIAAGREISELKKDEGAIVSADLRKLAVYRTENGELKALSPVCPHMGCYVRWNRGEKTWDCPCHGSRFDTSGHVINGPAVCGLTPITVQDEKNEPPKKEVV